LNRRGPFVSITVAMTDSAFCFSGNELQDWNENKITINTRHSPFCVTDNDEGQNMAAP